MPEPMSSSVPADSGRLISAGEKILLVALLALPVYAAWARGGTYVPWQPPLLWIALGLLFVLLTLPLWPRATLDYSSLLGRLWRDPVLYLGTLFLGLLLLQWWNSGRDLIFSYSQMRWEYCPPPHPGWPFAFQRTEAFEMLSWFFPAWILLLALRARALGARAVSVLWRGLVGNAGLLALFGMIQYLSGTTAIFWRQPLDCVFFASFGYSNHAGAFFTLMLAAAVGFFLQESSWHRGPARWGRLWFFGGTAVLCLLGANLSLSRTAILLSWGVAGLALLDVVVHRWSQLSLAERGRRLLWATVLLGVTAGVVLAVARDTLWQEFRPAAELSPGIPVVMRGESLCITIPAAWRIWKQDPWVGVGGWGFRYLLSLNIPREQWSKIVTGNANVHNDPLQFLAEFGFVGAGLMGLVLWNLSRPGVRGMRRAGPAFRFMGLGLVLMGLYSLMDIPFRCPAILYTWLALLALLPDTAARRKPAAACECLNEVKT